MTITKGRNIDGHQDVKERSKRTSRCRHKLNESHKQSDS